MSVPERLEPSDTDRTATVRYTTLDAERARGREARNPLEIGWRGWWDIANRLRERVVLDHIGLVTAGVTFYVFLAMVPALIGIATLYGSMVSDVTLASHVSLLKGYLPDQSLDLLARELERVQALSDGGLSIAACVSFVLSVWAMNNAVIALFSAMNIAYGEIESRTYVALYARSFAFTLASLVAGTIIVSAVVLLPLLFSGEEFFVGAGGRAMTAAVLFLTVCCGASAIYRWGSCRRPALWRWIMPGALTVATAWLAVSTVLSWYLSHVANYAAVYGSLGTIVALLMWFYISIYGLLLGAQLNAEIEHQTAVDTTVSRGADMGARGAYVADTIGRRA